MSEISMITALLGALTAALGATKAAIELISRAQKGQSQKEDEE